MKLALDASVLLTVFNQEPGTEDWMEVLIQACRQGLLVLCEIVYAEVTPAFESRAELDKVLADLGAHLDRCGTGCQANRRKKPTGGTGCQVNGKRKEATRLSGEHYRSSTDRPSSLWRPPWKWISLLRAHLRSL